MRIRSRTLLRTSIAGEQQPPKTPTLRPFDYDKARSQIRVSFIELSQVVSRLEQLIEKRVSAHQQSLIDIMKVEVSEMQKDIRSIVQKYNAMIYEKNRDEELTTAKAQLAYCRNQVQELNRQNFQLRMEVARLKKISNEQRIDFETSRQSLSRLTKKVLRYRQREKTLSQSLLKDKKDSLIRSKQELSNGFFLSQKFLPMSPVTPSDLKQQLTKRVSNTNPKRRSNFSLLAK